MLASISPLDPNIIGKKDDDNHDDDGFPLRFTLRAPIQTNRELSIKNLLDNKSKVGVKPTP